MKRYVCCEVGLVEIASIPSNITFGYTVKDKRIILHYSNINMVNIAIESNSKIIAYAVDSHKPSYIYIATRAKLGVIYNDSKVVSGFVRVKKGIYSVKRQVEWSPTKPWKIIKE